MQSYYIYQNKDLIIARGRADGSILMQSADASTVMQCALNALQEQQGGQMMIECGTYLINTPLNVPAMVTIQGSGRATVLKLTASNPEGIIMLLDTVESSVIENLTCQGIAHGASYAGIVLHECGDCEVRGITSRDFSGYGFVLRHHCFMNKLLHNTTSGNGRAGTRIEHTGQGRGGDWTPNLIMGCTSIGEQGHGFEFDHAICTNVVGCQVYQVKGYGYYIHSESNSTCITGSRVYQGYSNGIMVEHSHELNVSSNIICWNQGHGIELNHVIWGTVSANNFIDNGGRVEPTTYGIYMHTDTNSVQITANALFNWEGHNPMRGGILETEDCHNNQISHNTVNYYEGEAAVSLGQNSYAAHNLGHQQRYPHPGSVPFPVMGEPFTGPPINPERIENFLNLTRR